MTMTEMEGSRLLNINMVALPLQNKTIDNCLGNQCVVPLSLSRRLIITHLVGCSITLACQLYCRPCLCLHTKLNPKLPSHQCMHQTTPKRNFFRHAVQVRSPIPGPKKFKIENKRNWLIFLLFSNKIKILIIKWKRNKRTWMKTIRKIEKGEKFYISERFKKPLFSCPMVT